jgi:hypothetical protein
MTRILLVETASPKRVRAKAEEILAGGIYADPQVIILCSDDLQTIRYLSDVQGAEILPLWEDQKKSVLRGLAGRTFDVQYTFWTGEKRYNRMKLAAMRIRPAVVHVDIGDGSVFRLTWKAIIRHGIFRWQHRLPSDHWGFVHSTASVPYYAGEKVLIVQSADPLTVLKGLKRLEDKPLFRNPRYTLFCRNRPEIVRHFEGHPMLAHVRAHSETRGAWRHLRALRREHFAAVIVFFTGDPSYWKVKYFAFLLGARHKVVFNENCDCFYFTLGKWLPFVARRWGARAQLGNQPKWTHQLRILLSLLLKVVLFPFRFAWLLLVWVWLRTRGLRSAS